jgi:hypothetical protein
MRVNPEVGLGSFAQTTGDKAHKKVRTGFVPLPKDPDAAPPNKMSLWERGFYESPKQGYVRPGANDFLSIRSKGV